MSLKRLIKESLVYGISGYVSKSISIFLLPLYTKALAPQDYGILDLLGTISIVFTFLIVSGTDSALGYFYFNKNYFSSRALIVSTAFFIRLIFAVLIFVIIFIASPLISNTMFGKDLSLFVIITGLTLIFTSIHSFLFDLLRFEFRKYLYSILSSANVLINISISFYFVIILEMGVMGAILGQCLSYGLIFLFTCVYVIKNYGIGISGEWFKKIFSYGFPLIGTGIAFWVLSSTDRYFLAHYKGLETTGIYAVGTKLASVIGLIAGALQIAWGPLALDIQYESNAKQIYAKVFLLFSIVNTVIVFLISMFSIDILTVFTQPEYYSAKAVVPFLCFSTIFWSGYFIVAVGINITKKLHHTIWITIAAAALNIILNFLLTPSFGAIGASFSIMSANFLIFILTLNISQKHYRIKYSYGKLLFLLLPAILIIFITYMYDFSLALRIGISSVYIIVAVIYIYKTNKDSEEFTKFMKMIRMKKD